MKSGAIKRLARVELEPLSDQRWGKIERSLFAEWEKRSGLAPDDGGKRWKHPMLSWRVWLVAGALVGAFAVVVFSVIRIPQHAVVEQPTRITTGVESSHLALPGLSVDVEPGSAVVVGAETPQGLLIVLDRGSIVCQVSSRSSNTPLIVQAGATRVRVIGTRFSVTRLGETARVKVQQGVVEVTQSGLTRRIHSGEEWPGELAAPQVVVEEAEPSQAEPSQAAQGEALARSAEPLPHSDVVRSPAADAPADKPPGKVRQPAPEAPGTDEPTPDPETAKPAASRQAVFEQATLLEHSDPARASQLYRSLESGSDSWGQNALYARGRLAASRGNRSEARRLLNRYLQLFPRGSNVEDARAVLRGLE